MPGTGYLHIEIEGQLQGQPLESGSKVSDVISRGLWSDLFWSVAGRGAAQSTFMRGQPVRPFNRNNSPGAGLTRNLLTNSKNCSGWTGLHSRWARLAQGPHGFLPWWLGAAPTNCPSVQTFPHRALIPKRWAFDGMNGKKSLVAFHVIIQETLIEQLIWPKCHSWL